MRIAIPYENGNIFQHFGRSEAFKFYDVDGGAGHTCGEHGCGEHGCHS